VLLALKDGAGDTQEIATRTGLDTVSTLAALTISEQHGWAVRQGDMRPIWKGKLT
jgi:hypothetical protein